MRWKTGSRDVEGPGHWKLKRGEVESGQGAGILREQNVGVGKMKWNNGKVEEWKDGKWKKVDVEGGLWVWRSAGAGEGVLRRKSGRTAELTNGIVPESRSRGLAVEWSKTAGVEE
jgi:hypothetical protein